MQDAEADRAAPAVAEKRPPVLDEAVPDRLVDKEVVAIEPANGSRASSLDAREEHLVVRANLRRVAVRPEGRRDHLMLDAVGQAGKNTFDVVVCLEPEV